MCSKIIHAMATFPSETNYVPLLRWTDSTKVNRDLMWKHQTVLTFMGGVHWYILRGSRDLHMMNCWQYVLGTQLATYYDLRDDNSLT